MIYLKILFYLFTMSFILSQNTKYLQGKIIDSKTKDPLIGANVIIKGTAQGSATNVDGDFYISDIVQSMVNLQVSYIGCKTKTISDIDLKDGLNLDMVIELDADIISVTEVKVQAERKEGGQAEALAKKQDALELQDNISSDQISNSGDSHVADASMDMSLSALDASLILQHVVGLINLMDSEPTVATATGVMNI